MQLIKREIDAMTDYDQSILVTQGPKMLLDMLRPEAHEIAANYAKLRATVAAGKETGGNYVTATAALLGHKRNYLA
jgi:hypothetical protein